MVHDIQQLLFLADCSSKTTTYLEETPGTSHRVSSIPEYRNIIAVAKPTIVATDHVRNISPVIFHPLQSSDKLLRHP
jgi:hypothetical protein